MLDLCLKQLEDAQERGECILSAELVDRIGEVTAAPLVPSMAIVDAIELIFNEQERCLSGSREPIARREPVFAEQGHKAGAGRHHVVPASGRAQPDTEDSDMVDVWRDETATPQKAMSGQLLEQGSGPLCEAEARRLTDRIRTATRYVCLLLREVHERRAWVPLGYANWEQYVQTEFSISRSRSYELLDQANVILDLRSAAGMTELPNVSAYVALQIKPRLPMIKEALRQRIQEADGRRPVDIVAEVVDEHRRQVVQSRRLVQEQRARRQSADDPDDRQQFSEVIDALASMASLRRAEEVVDAVEPPQIANVMSAVQWLNDVLAGLQRKYRSRG